jgi:hypothetical protein
MTCSAVPDCFVTIKRLFGSDDFAPTDLTAAMYGHEKMSRESMRTEAGLEGLVQR